LLITLYFIEPDHGPIRPASTTIPSEDHMTDALRELDEEEARATLRMFWSASQVARVTVAQWNSRKRKPTKDEMFRLAMQLKSAEDVAQQMASGPPGDGHSLDILIDHFQDQIQKLLWCRRSFPGARARPAHRAPR
jgi:hypothetical protein